MTYEGGQFTRLIWYVRLSEAAFYQHPMSGVMRLEMFAPDDTDFLPPIVRQVANLSGTLLTRLGSRAHKDPRAAEPDPDGGAGAGDEPLDGQRGSGHAAHPGAHRRDVRA